MKPSVLWIDDVPEESVIFRTSLIRNGIDLIVANSVSEAYHRIANSEYDAFVLRPDLKMEGEPYSKKGIIDNPVQFFNGIYSVIRKECSQSKDKPLYIATFNREILKAVEEGFFTMDIIVKHSKDPLTKLLYMGEIRPAQFAYDLYEEILTRELANFKSKRESSRTDG